MRKLYFFVCLIISFSAVNAQENLVDKELNQVKYDLMKKYSPDGYHALNIGQSITNQGKALADQLVANLENNQNLINTMNPEDLLNDFNEKMKNIETLETNFTNQSLDDNYNSAKSVYYGLKSGDNLGAAGAFIGALNANAERRRAQREIAAKKEALKKQRDSQMSEIYWKAYDYIRVTKDEYLSRAAYAESEEEEKYNLEYANNLKCFRRSLKANFSTTNSSWLTNNCSKPKPITKTNIENKFIAKDVQLLKIAERKYTYYKQSDVKHFRDAATSFVSAAIKINPKAEYFYKLGSYYEGEASVLALSNYLAAFHADSSIFDDERKKKLEVLKEEVQVEITSVINDNNKTFLSTFIEAGLDKVIHIKDQNILLYSIQLDQPDVVQLILNKHIDGYEQSQIDETLKEVIMMCAIQNSPKTLQKFNDLGVGINFELRGKSTLDVALKAKSPEAFATIVNCSDNKSELDYKYRDLDLLKEGRTNLSYSKTSGKVKDSIVKWKPHEENSNTQSSSIYKIINHNPDGIDSKWVVRKYLEQTCSTSDWVLIKERINIIVTTEQTREISYNGRKPIIETVYRKGKDKICKEQENGDLTVVNGRKGYTYKKGVRKDMWSAEVNNIKNELTYYDKLLELENKVWEFHGLVEFKGEEYYAIGKGGATNFYDKISGLLIIEINETGDQKTYSNYKLVEGFKIPFKIIHKDIYSKVVTKVTDFKVNESIPGKKFK